MFQVVAAVAFVVLDLFAFLVSGSCCFFYCSEFCFCCSIVVFVFLSFFLVADVVVVFAINDMLMPFLFPLLFFSSSVYAGCSCWCC